MRKKILFFLLLFGWRGQAWAQIPHQPATVLSPNATNFQLFGEIPISFYTGTANIEVPLYTIQEGPLSVPISLNYHASGFRPDQHPGWVGQGWNLSVGGVINRSINDLPDEYDDPTTGGYALQRGFYFTHGLLDVADWNTNTRIRALGSETDRGVPKYISDTEPDEFSFSFMGYSGKFYLDHKGVWQVQSDKPLKVTLLNPSNPFVDVPIPRPRDMASNGPYPKVYGGFSILTEDGTQYIFGGVAEAIEYSLPFYMQSTAPWLADSWQLTKIVAPDGHQIAFSYQRENGTYINQMYISFDQQIVAGHADDGSFLGLGPGMFDCMSWSDDLTGAPETNYRGKLLSPVYLKSIQSTNTTVEFTRGNTTELTYRKAVYGYAFNKWFNDSNKQYDFLPYLEDKGNGITYFSNPEAVLQKLQWKQLNQIAISQRGVLQKSFGLQYSSTDIERLTLKQVTEIGSDGISKPPYQFTYNDYRTTYQGTVYNQQPQYLASQTDHWGFFNDTYATFQDRVNYSRYRDPNPAAAVYLSGLLKRITYPTGGITDFTYEPHWYGKQLGLDRAAPANASPAQLAGGVRIKRVSSYSLTDQVNKVEKEYFYVSGYSASATLATIANLPSTGVLGGQVQYNISYTLKDFNNNNNNSTFNIFSSQSVLPSSMNSRGSHIGYSQVVEKRNDNSYTKFTFSNFDTESGHPDDPGNVLQDSRTPYEPFSSREQERGKLTNEEMYTATDQCVKRHQTEYIAFPQKDGSNAYVRSVKMRLLAICSTSQTSLQEGTAYRFYTYAYLPSKDTETLFDSNGANPVTTTTTYGYDPTKLLANVITTDSKGQSLSTSYTYPFNIVYPANTQPPTESEASAIYAMTARNMLSYPIETVTARNGLRTATKIQTYKWGGKDNAYVLPYKTYSLETKQPLTSTQFTASAYSSFSSLPFVVGSVINTPNNVAQVRLKATCTLYDAASNLLGLLKDGGGMTSYLWGYKNTLPIAKVENAAPSEIFHSNFEEGTGWDSSISYDIQQPRTGLKAGLLTSYNVGDQYHSFGTTPLTIASTNTKKFVLSGWVYSEGPTAQLWLFMYQAGQTGYAYTQVDYIATNPTDINKWVYLEKEIDVPQNQGIVTLNCRLTNYYRQVNADQPDKKGGRVWFDDVRIHPADAQMTTYTHLPQLGVTSISDINNRPVYYEYDGLNRLWVVRDQNRNIIKQYQYHYQR